MIDFLDEHLFALCAIATVGMQLLFFLVAYTCQFDKVTDFAGGTNFILLAVLTLLLADSYTTRQVYVTCLVVVSRGELALFLLNRVLSRGKDSRFDEMRAHLCRFFGFWVFQMIWVFGVSVAFIFLNTTVNYDPALETRDWVGIALFVIGFVVQFVADVHKHRFRGDPANKGKLCRGGVWSWSRHPNYFGEILLWWGIFVCCTPVFDGPSPLNLGYITVLSPILTMAILLLLSGMTIAESDSFKRYYKPGDPNGYVEYIQRTSILIPLPPAVYGSLPLFLKRVLLFEWSIYDHLAEIRAGATPKSPLVDGSTDGAGAGAGGATSPAVGTA